MILWEIKSHPRVLPTGSLSIIALGLYSQGEFRVNAWKKGFSYDSLEVP